jgi:hypothetical protein
MEDFREALPQILFTHFCEETGKDDLPFPEKIVSSGRIEGPAILINVSKREKEKIVQAVYGGMKLKTYVKDAVFVYGLDGIENGGKMIGHDWMLRRKGEGRGEDAGLERKNPADGEG